MYGEGRKGVRDGGIEKERWREKGVLERVLRAVGVGKATLPQIQLLPRNPWGSGTLPHNKEHTRKQQVQDTHTLHHQPHTHTQALHQPHTQTHTHKHYNTGL